VGGGADLGLTEPGWHEVARQDEVPEGEVVRRTCGRTELILWRRHGEVVCQEAWCPHAWADLRGARVTDDGCIECPFHSWRFDAEGFHVQLFRPPNARERLRTFPARVDGDVIYAWW
jgi:3-ketosteroid 9alpha-monooxygenase subunit A